MAATDRALVVERRRAVALEVGHLVARDGRVDRQLLVVDADAVTVRVRVREQARLEDGVGRGLNAGNHVRRVLREGQRAHEIVLRT